MSSHYTIFLVKPIVIGAWFIQAVLVFLILCSRKHYTVDIVVALYTVPMVWALLQWKLKDPKVEMCTFVNIFFLCKISKVKKQKINEYSNYYYIITTYWFIRSLAPVLSFKLSKKLTSLICPLFHPVPRWQFFWLPLCASIQ